MWCAVSLIVPAENAATTAAAARAGPVLTWRLIASRAPVRWIAARIVLARNAATTAAAVFAVNVPADIYAKKGRAAARRHATIRNAATTVAVAHAAAVARG
jgi:hypothetical protein